MLGAATSSFWFKNDVYLFPGIHFSFLPALLASGQNRSFVLPALGYQIHIAVRIPDTLLGKIWPSIVISAQDTYKLRMNQEYTQYFMLA